MLEFAEEIFDEMARLVHLLVKGALDFATTLGRNHRGFTVASRGSVTRSILCNAL